MGERGTATSTHCPPECGGRCCAYFALEIDTPTEKKDFDNIRWYLFHEKVAIYVSEGCWHLLVHNRCLALDQVGRCRRYSDRPTICRRYSPSACEFNEEVCFDLMFRTVEELDDYVGKRFPSSKKRCRTENP